MNIVIVFPKKEINSKINNILQKNGFRVVSVCRSGAQALQAVEALDMGIIISSVRYVDMTYAELKNSLPCSGFEMIVLGTHGQWEQYGEDDVVFLPFPFKAYDLVELVNDYSWNLEREQRKKKNKPKARNERDQGLINQAKERMMERNGWTEEEAHRFLQKNSMDTGRNLVETAECILEMF